MVAGPYSHGALLAAILGRNPSAYGLPETHLALADTLDGMVHQMVGVRGTQLHGLLRAVAHLLSGEQSITSIEMAWRWILRNSHWPAAWVSDFLRARVAPLRPVERVTSSLFDPDAVQRLVRRHPDAEYVHVVRHPRAHAEAALAGGGSAAMLLGSYDEDVSPPILDPQVLWLRAEEAADSLRAKVAPDAVHLLRIEDVLESPDTALGGLCRRLGLPHDPASIARMKRPEEGPFSCFGPLGAHLGDDPEFLADPRLPGPANPPRLAGALAWRPDGTGFRAELIRRARSYGYR